MGLVVAAWNDSANNNYGNASADNEDGANADATVSDAGESGDKNDVVVTVGDDN